MRPGIPRTIVALALIGAVGTVMLRTRLLENRIHSGQADADPSDDKLESNISEIHFDGVPLVAAIDELARKSGANIRVNWEAFEKENLDRNALVHLRLYDLPLARTLQLTVAEAGGSGTSEPRCVPLDGEIFVTPSYSPSVQPAELRMYDVTDLASRFLSFGPASSSEYLWSTPQRMDGLTSVLESFVPHDSGEAATFGFAGRLFVLRNRTEHNNVVRVIYNLRKLQDARDRGELLDPINGDETLDFAAKNGAGSIPSENSMPGGITRLYDVRDFADRFVGPVDLNSGSPKIIDSAADRKMTRRDRIDALLILIHRYADPNAWSENNGDTLTIREEGGFMSISLSPENQRRVALVLHNLRKLRASVDRGENPATQPIHLLQAP